MSNVSSERTRYVRTRLFSNKESVPYSPADLRVLLMSNELKHRDDEFEKFYKAFYEISYLCRFLRRSEWTRGEGFVQ